MFAKFVSATLGEDTGAEAKSEVQDSQNHGLLQDDNKDSISVQSKDSTDTSFSLWGVASSLADTVKRNTAEITTGLKETNWRAELEAFGKGVREEEHQLRKETVKRVEVAKEHLPKDATAQLDLKRRELTAHLQKMGVGLGGLGKTLVTRTTDLFDQVRDTVVEELSANERGKDSMKKPGSRPPSTGKYSRLEADISSMQRDSATYCDEPADTADYQTWRSNFDLASYQPAVEDLITNNAFMAELQARIVPVIVEYDAFWTRYFYRLHLLEARHLQRLEVAQRASRAQQEEELGWDDAESDDQSQAQQPAAPVSSSDKSKQLSQAESPPPPSSSAQGAAVTVEGTDREVDAVAPSMQAVPEEHEGTGGSRQTGGRPDQRQEVTETATDTRSKEDHRTTGTAGEEDAADTVTSSDSGSANEHWTVVKSPSKQRDGEGTNVWTATEPSGDSHANVAAGAGTTDQSKPVKSPPAAASSKGAVSQADDSSEIDELDDVSNGGDPDGSPGSEAEEDWGAWE